MKKVIVLTAAVLVSTASYAQFGNLIGGATSAVTGGGGSSVSVQQITDNYVAGSKQIVSAQSNLLKAVDQNIKVDEQAAVVRNLTAGATSQQIEDADKIITERNAALKEKYSQQGLVLDAKAKKQFALGMKDFALGVISYVKLGVSVKGFKPSASDIGSAGTAIAIAKSVPTDIGNLKDTFGVMYDYAKSNNIPLPKEATEGTKALADWK